MGLYSTWCTVQVITLCKSDAQHGIFEDLALKSYKSIVCYAHLLKLWVNSVWEWLLGCTWCRQYVYPDVTYSCYYFWYFSAFVALPKEWEIMI